MVLMLLIAVIAAIGGALRARHEPARRTLHPKLRWWPVLLLAVAGQSILALTSPAVRGLLAAVDCAAVGMWCGLNRRSRSGLPGLPGLPLLGVGSVLNCIVIAVNGGMPVSRWALGVSGLGRQLDVTKGHLDKHVIMSGSTNLGWLGDAIPVPGLRTVVSAGDVLMLMGIAAAAYTAAHHLMPVREPGDVPGGKRARSAGNTGAGPSGDGARLGATP